MMMMVLFVTSDYTLRVSLSYTTVFLVLSSMRTRAPSSAAVANLCGSDFLEAVRSPSSLWFSRNLASRKTSAFFLVSFLYSLCQSLTKHDQDNKKS